MSRTDPLWALAPQYAESVFAGFRQGNIKAAEPGIDFSELLTSLSGKTAVIKISGPLYQETRLSIFGGGIYALGYDAIAGAIRAALDNPQVSAILLSIDSPGGSVAGAKELADYIAEASAVKPMAAYANGLCASAAFWLAAATGKVYAPATALVGSVGVIMCVEDWSAWYEKMGVKMEYVASGKFKAAGQDGRELSEDERKYFEGQLAEIHAIFKQDVAKALAITADESLWAEAQLMPSTQALAAGLVTRIVRDEAEAVHLLGESAGKELVMTYTLEALQKDAPDLLASIQKEAFEKGRSEGIAAQDAAALAVIRLVCPKETAEACEKMLAEAKRLNLSAAQIEGMAALLPKPEEKSQEQSRLEAIIAAHQPPVNVDPEPEQPKSRLVANAEARAKGVR